MIHMPFSIWFSAISLAGGDWKYFWPENIHNILTYSYAWDSSLNNGLGQNNVIVLWLNSYLSFIGYFYTQILHIPWPIAEKLLFFVPIIGISTISSFIFSRIFMRNVYINVLSSIIFFTNTYALMIFSGGQVGVGLAYSLIPLVFFVWHQTLAGMSTSTRSFFTFYVKKILVFTLTCSLQILFEPRIFFLTAIILLLYGFFYYFYVRSFKIKYFILVCFSVIFLIFCIHAFWILPAIISILDVHGSFLQALPFAQFLSFSHFSDGFSLLHPNWPENIFGKISFMRPEFLLLPLLAYSSLFFISSKKQSFLFFFALLGIVGAFLAKGVNPPLGFFYEWFLKSMPGFSAFRDPSKWYMFVSLSYSILIPYSIYMLCKQFIHTQITRSKSLINIPLISISIYIVFCLFWIYSIRYAFTNVVGGTFINHDVPAAYRSTEEFLREDKTFSRVLWIPRIPKFNSSSPMHPALSAENLFHQSDPLKLATLLMNQKTINRLQTLSVKYILIPFDSQSEIFLHDRHYDNKLYLSVVNIVEKNVYVKKTSSYGKIVLFTLKTSKDHFWSSNCKDILIHYRYINPTFYTLVLEHARSGCVIIFSEGYDSNWVAKGNNYLINSTSYDTIVNSFVLQKDGDYSLQIVYTLQEWVDRGRIISIVSIIGCIISLGFIKNDKKYD